MKKIVFPLQRHELFELVQDSGAPAGRWPGARRNGPRLGSLASQTCSVVRLDPAHRVCSKGARGVWVGDAVRAYMGTA